MTDPALKPVQAAWDQACKVWSLDDCRDLIVTMKRGEAMMYAATDLICAQQDRLDAVRADKLLIIDLIDVALRMPPQRAINSLREAVRQTRANLENK